MNDEMRTLITADTKIKVSSTLDKSAGKKNLTDGNPDTCWTSQQGLPQYIELSFPSPVIPKKLSIVFQGGFVGTRCSVDVLPNRKEATGTSKEWQMLCRVYPEDVNRQQSFELLPSDAGLLDVGVENLRIVIEESSDFFGRITVYDLHLDGDFP